MTSAGVLRALLSRGLMTGKRSVLVSVNRPRVRVCIKLLTAPNFSVRQATRRFKAPRHWILSSRSGFMGLARQTTHNTSTRRVVFSETPCENPFRINCRRFIDPGALRPMATHSITSSAATSRVCGTVSPNDLAVLRLMTNSNLVGYWIGSSAGLVPRKMRSTYDAARR
jgi:hypothetical protein